MSALRKGAVTVGVGALLYGLYRLARKPGDTQVSRLTSPSGPLSFLRYDAGQGEYTTHAGPWRAAALPDTVNMAPRKGGRYMAIATGAGGSVTLEGVLVTDANTNNVPLSLRVDRVVKVRSGSYVPKVPFTLSIPASENSIFAEYLDPTRWASIHATSVSESPREGSKPAPGKKVRFAMRERNQLGNSVVVIDGYAMSDGSKDWPKEAGEPDDEHVLVSTDSVVRAVRGDENVSLPPVFVVPVENLIA